MGVFADISKEALPKKIMSQYRIISICERTVKIIHYAEEGASLITRGSKDFSFFLSLMHICFNNRAIQTECIQCILKTIFECVLSQIT